MKTYDKLKHKRNKARDAIHDAHYISGLNILTNEQYKAAINVEKILKELSKPIFEAFERAYKKKYPL